MTLVDDNPPEPPVIFRHRLMWAQSSHTPFRAECFRCGEELERDTVFGQDWQGKETGSYTCRVQG